MWPSPAEVPKRKINNLKNNLFAHRKITEDGCWIWVGKTKRYATMRVGTHSGVGVHRVSLFVYKPEEYSEFLPVLHKCDTPACFNPEHLYSGTQSENILEAVSKGRHFGASKTACAQGHAYTEDNTYIVAATGKRQCKICRANRNTIGNFIRMFK